MTRLLSSIVMLCLLVLPARGAWDSFVVNFTKDLYGNGAQTWQVNSQIDNYTFFANQRGLVQYNSHSWRVFPLPNRLDVRSLHVDPDAGRIYVGGINEYGYFSLAPNGDLRYTSVNADIADGAIHYPGNVWGVYKDRDGDILYCGDERVVRYARGACTGIELEGGVMMSACIDGTLYVANAHGLFSLSGNKFSLVPGSESIAEHRIRAVLPLDDSTLLLATSDGGIYTCSKAGIASLNTPADTFMRLNEVFCAAIHSHLIALGTVRGGVVVIDLDTNEAKYYDEGNGLQNNTVLSLGFDPIGNLWAGLDRGISLIVTNYPLTQLPIGLSSIGMGYTAAVHQGTLYLGTNRGLYATPYLESLSTQHPVLRPIEGINRQVWDLCAIDGQLFCCSDRGLFIIDGDKAQLVPDIGAVWTLRTIPGDTDRLWAGSYNGLWMLARDEGGAWRAHHKVTGSSDSFRKFQNDGMGGLWVANAGELERLTLDRDATQVVRRKSYASHLGDDLDMYSMTGHLYFASRAGTWQYDRLADLLVRVPSGPYQLPNPSSSIKIKTQGSRIYTVGTNQVSITDPNSRLRKVTAQFHPHMVTLVESYENLVPIDEKTAIVPHERGFALFQANGSDIVWQRENGVRIHRLVASAPYDTVLYYSNFMNDKPRIEVPAAMKALRVEVGPRNVMQGPMMYSFKVDDGAWSHPSEANYRDLASLRPGRHVLLVQASDTDGNTFDDSIEMLIHTPWYRTILAFFVYGIMFAALVWLLTRWQSRHTLKIRQQAVLDKEREMQRMEEQFEAEKAEAEKQIEHLEKEKLETELKHKSLEVANMMVNVVRKNEMLSEIKTEITRVISSSSHSAAEMRHKLAKITEDIDVNINDSDVLKKIEAQFDIVHNDFMRNLERDFPTLSINERMMCAYLRMNLSTKEIAPLFNLSVRGVETIRYRLRKKMGLSREDSLTDFLAKR